MPCGVYNICHMTNNEKLPKVSIIVPIYNVENYIRRCLDSLVNQTLKDIEIILIDDGSPDDSGKIADEYATMDKRIIVVHQKNSGAAVARNAGLKLARGEYIGFVDPDDWVDVGFFNGLYRASEKSGSDIVKGRAHRRDLNGVIDEGPSFEMIRKNKAWFHYSFWSAIYKASFIKKHKIDFPAGVITGQDVVFLTKAVCLADRIELVENNLAYNYEKREDSLDSKLLSDEKIISKLDASEIIFDTIKHADIDREAYIIKFSLWIDYLLSELPYRTASEDMRELIAKRAREFYENSKYKTDYKRKFPIHAEFLGKNNTTPMINFAKMQLDDLKPYTQRIELDNIRLNEELQDFLGVKRSIKLVAGNIIRYIEKRTGNEQTKS